MNFNYEELKKAKMAKSAEELIAVAKESGIVLTEEQAQVYFEQLNSPSAELADEELDNVAGGGCKKTDASERESGSISEFVN